MSIYRNMLTLMSFLLFITNANAIAQSATPGDPLAAYTATWEELDSKARLAIIQSYWTEESRYEDQSISTKGITAFNDMISGFQKSFPGARFYGGRVAVKDSYRTWLWQVVDADNKIILNGRDFAIVNKMGKIEKIIGFFDAPNEHIHPKHNEDIAAQYFKYLFKTQDFAAMAGIIAPTAVYSQAKGLPYGGEYVGFEGIMSMFTQASSYFDLRIEGEPIIFTNMTTNTVIINFTITCKSKMSGKEITMPISEHFEVRGGLIYSIRPFYFDTKVFSDFLK